MACAHAVGATRQGLLETRIYDNPTHAQAEVPDLRTSWGLVCQHFANIRKPIAWLSCISRDSI
uniref:Uncharacterized protein n=1 Tax=Ralstonia syzygii R24 TaxID=907261 RepID=G2ZYJ3_9RALS|nr:hypothetical protein RALSY_10148 [Ralstonia syzygii R24]